MEKYEQIRLLRALRGMTQAQLAEASGIPRPVIAELESGHITLSEYYMTKLQTALQWPKLADVAFRLLEE